MPFIGSEYRHPDEVGTDAPAKAKAESIDLHAFASGDMSVGIPHTHWTIQDVGTLDDYAGQREDVRQAFVGAFSMLTDSQVQIRFSDEPAED